MTPAFGPENEIRQNAGATRSHSPILVICALIVAQFVAADGITCIYVMLPSIFREFPDQGPTVGWIVTTFFLVASMSAAVGGRLADLLGRRKIAIAILLIAGIGAGLGMAARTPAMLIGASLLLGATTTLTPILIGLAREHLPARQVGLGVGAIAAAGTVGAGMIYVGAGFIVDSFGRTGGYAFTALLAMIAATLLVLAVPRSRDTGFKMADVDFLRGVLFGPAAAGLILSIELIASDGFALKPAAVLIASLLLAAYWIHNQWRQPRPLIDLKLMRVGSLPRTFLVMTFLGVAGIEQGQVFSLLFQQEPFGGAGFGLSATRAGFMMLIITSTALFVAPAAGVMCRKYGGWVVALIGAGTISLSWVLMAFALTSLTPLIITGILAIAGVSLLMPANYLLIVKDTPPDLTSGATGLGYTVYNLGFAAGSQIVLSLLYGRANGPGAIPDAGDYRTALYWLAAASSVMAILLLSWRDRRMKAAGE